MSESPTGNYFVAAYPPFSAWTTEQGLAVAAELAQLESVGESPWGVYIHLPYCEKRCDFCYYLAFAGTSQCEMSDYVERLAREAEVYVKLPRFAGSQPSFVYIGGGTPSRLPAEALERL